jgi:hypothetical protein
VGFEITDESVMSLVPAAWEGEHAGKFAPQARSFMLSDGRSSDARRNLGKTVSMVLVIL